MKRHPYLGVGTLVLLVLGGCAPTVYYHPTNPQADLKRDAAECELYATQKTDWTVQSLGFHNPILYRQAFRQCLTDIKGWREQSQP